MASTGAVIYIKPRAFVTDAPGRHTGAVLDVAIRMISGVYSVLGVAASTDQRGLKSWLPHRRDRWMQDDGTPTDEFFRFMDYLANTMIGGPSTATLPDVVATVTSAQANATTAAATVAGVSQQVNSNAESLSVVVEVAVNNSLVGAAQIPPVQHTSGVEP
jgi:hypothetical protein